jgi:hypothetical protein
MSTNKLHVWERELDEWENALMARKNGVVAAKLLTVIKCKYLPPTCLHFIQDVEDRCLLLTSFINLPFQEHR